MLNIPRRHPALLNAPPSCRFLPAMPPPPYAQRSRRANLLKGRPPEPWVVSRREEKAAALASASASWEGERAAKVCLHRRRIRPRFALASNHVEGLPRLGKRKYFPESWIS